MCHHAQYKANFLIECRSYFHGYIFARVISGKESKNVTLDQVVIVMCVPLSMHTHIWYIHTYVCICVGQRTYFYHI